MNAAQFSGICEGEGDNITAAGDWCSAVLELFEDSHDHDFFWINFICHDVNVQALLSKSREFLAQRPSNRGSFFQDA